MGYRTIINSTYSIAQRDRRDWKLFVLWNPETDKLIEEGLREKDQQKRKEIYARAQVVELEEVVLIPIRTISHLAITTKNTEGLWMNPVGFFIFNEVTVKSELNDINGTSIIRFI
ncbi:hypothetical protein J31TS6_26690 [Brevibacillus reuszeri]|uniref:hypothetical protein n=1 Tax=Brevibacillus reuszeri TaxID=54915 RepID=UPI001B23B02D|nr:hypothetical protein [Brevibacillus reuszeri]GIO06641.1 hypothetical protein J31TS6_26690 [Brevibacillus reuszeri]